MLPLDLAASSFNRYPHQGRAVAAANLVILRQMPLPLAASILREVSHYDWLFPAEQREITAQFTALASFSDHRRTEVLSGFAALRVPASLAAMDWVNDPKRFLEAFTAFLWSSHQIDAFHTAANAYAQAVKLGAQGADLPLPRTCMVLVPRELDKPGYPLFRKLRSQGVLFDTIDGELTSEILNQWMASRCSRYPAAFTHFYIDGGEPLDIRAAQIETISWNGVSGVRQALLERMHRLIDTPGAGPELARTELAGLTPGNLGLQTGAGTAVMDHLAVSVLTEGSGTQIFSTTFAQWTARELLRRARPATLLVRFTPRQQLQPMNEMLAGTAPPAAPDLPGSLMDADMGAYYTWINLQRLPGASSAVFVAYAEARRQAVAVGPGLPRGTTSPGAFPVAKLMELVA